MKTAVSIPDKVFRQADRLAKRLRISRSELYAQAVSALLKAHEQREITARINAVLGPNGEGSELDPDLQQAAFDTLARSEWDETR